MFKKVFYLRDPKSSFYWDGATPGKLTLTPERFWLSREEAESRFAAYVLYHSALKACKMPLELELEEFDVVLTASGASVVNTDTHKREFFRGRIKRHFGKYYAKYDGLTYLIGREKEPETFQYWCKLSDSPTALAARSGNPAFIDMMERVACVKKPDARNHWVGVKDVIDFTFLKLATPILLTVITEEYLK